LNGVGWNVYFADGHSICPQQHLGYSSDGRILGVPLVEKGFCIAEAQRNGSLTRK